MENKVMKLAEVDVEAERERSNVIEDGNDILLTTRKKERTGLNLYVKNLDGTIDDERLHNEFSVFGRITSAKVMVTGGLPNGYGFVHFHQAEDASKAIEKMNGAVVAGKVLYADLYQNKKERYAHHAEKYNLPPKAQVQAQTHSIFFSPHEAITTKQWWMHVVQQIQI